jgi:hypothetical protein
MSETVTLIAQINAGWRVLRVAGRPGWGRPAWSLQRMADGGEWQGVAVVRASHMLREMVRAWAGAVDAETAGILNALPQRCDIREPGSPPKPKPKKKRVAVRRRRSVRTNISPPAAAIIRPWSPEKRAAAAAARAANAAAAEKARVNPVSVPKPGAKRSAVAAAFIAFRAPRGAKPIAGAECESLPSRTIARR